MPSEHRLHPSSIVFSFAEQLKNFAVPGILVLFGVGRSGGDWERWLFLLIIPNTLVAVLRYLSFRYRYEETEMIIRSGMVFRNERHVPYARIQNLDAVQHIGHRLLNVVEVRIETGAGREPEAVMSAVPQAAYEEMRRRVFAGLPRMQPGISPGATDASVDGAAVAEPVAPPSRTLLHLSPRELLLCGFIENRGAVLIAAGVGVMWELGAERFFDRVFDESGPGRGILREMASVIFRGSSTSIDRVMLAAAAIVLILIGARVLSMIWAVIRLYDFRLTRTGDDLRLAYGSLTRVVATVPIRKIQSITLRQGLLQRLCSRMAVRVDTAGAEHQQTAAAERAWLAPIITPEAGRALVREIVPEIASMDFDWRPVHPRAFRRIFRVSAWIAGIVGLGTIYWFGWWSVVAFAVLMAWGFLEARQYVRHTHWAASDAVVTFRHGWLRRDMTIVRYGKMQVLGVHESPFDRRHGMASVSVDTAGAEGGAALRIPYLDRRDAERLHARLVEEATRREFAW